MSKARRWLLIAGSILIVAGIVAAWLASYSYFLSAGTSALADNEFEKSSQLLLRAVSLRPRSAEAHYRLAVAYRRSGKPKEAQQHLRQAKELGWNADDVNRQQLLVKAESGKFQDVEPALRALLKTLGND